MFCSKCGKTLMPEDRQCPHCGAPVGESRFEGTPYTSAQAHILPDAPAGQAVAAYTRTTYTTMPEEQQQEGAVDSRTTYRPVYDEASAPEAIREDMRAEIDAREEEKEKEKEAPQIAPEDLPEDVINTLNAVDEELKMESVDTSELHSRPIESTGRAGISAGVEDYIQKLEANQSRKASRRRRAYDEGEDAYTAPQDTGTYEEGEGDSSDPGQSEVFNDIDEEEFDEIRYGRAIGPKDILRVALIMVLAAALIVGGVMWFRHIRGGKNAAKIEGVTQTLYDEGLALIKTHTENTYVNELVNEYRSGDIVGLTTKVTGDAAVIDALLPEEPAVNDPLFISALQTVQTNIGNAVLMDITEAQSGEANASQNSENRWSIIREQIARLENASTAQELTAILNGDRVTVEAAATATPLPEATYTPLQKGDKSDAVLDMQNRLYMLGFLLDDRDGDFGSKTQTAVKLFQQTAGLNPTGIADHATLSLLYSNEAPMTEYAQITPSPAPTPEPTPEPEPEPEAAE